MERFDTNGHLTDAALLELIQGGDPGGLARLETAEHLAYCDACLQRYTQLLTEGALLTPVRSCREGLWRRLRQRTIRIFTSRYATAAAAVALALTVLWTSAGVTAGGAWQQAFQKTGAAVTQRVQTWPERWGDALHGAMAGVNEFFDGFGGSGPQDNEGGTHS